MRRLILYLAVSQILVLFVAELAVLAGMDQIYPEGYSDPFAPYDAIMPGQLVAAARESPCELQLRRIGYFIMADCEQQPAEGHFLSVISYVYNRRFTQISFSAQDLSIGDIVRRWGRPDLVVRFNPRSLFVRWIDRGLVGIIDPVDPSGRFSYMQPIENFTIGFGQPYNHP